MCHVDVCIIRLLCGCRLLNTKELLQGDLMDILASMTKMVPAGLNIMQGLDMISKYIIYILHMYNVGDT